MPVPVVTQPSTPRVVLKGVAIPTLNISATNTPTSYAASPLPTGLSVNTSTGAITGTPTEAEVVETTITATNGSGTSAAVTMVWQIQDSADGVGDWSDLELDFDLVTREVSIPGVEKQDGDVVVTLLTRDSINLLVGFKKWGVLQEVDSGGDQARVSFSLKEFEPEQNITLSADDVAVVGSGSSSRYRVPLSISRQDWSLLSSYEDDRQTAVKAVGSLELQLGYPGYDDTETANHASLDAGIGVGEVTGTLIFTGLDTGESPMDFTLELTVSVSGRPNQTVNLTRTFTATWSGGAWVISSLAGTSSGSGAAESPWTITLNNTGVTGDADSVDVAYQLTTNGTEPVGTYTFSFDTGVTGDLTDPDSPISYSLTSNLFIQDVDEIDIGDTALPTSFTNPADFFAELEAAWDTIMGTTGEIISIVATNVSAITITVDGGTLARHISIDSTDPPGTYYEGTHVPDLSGVSSGTVSGTLSADPTTPPLRFTSQPFYTRVIRDWLND